MRRALPLLVLFCLTASTSWASSHTRASLTTHSHLITPSVPTRNHAPGICPTQEAAHLTESIETRTQAIRQSTFGAFIVRTLLGFFSH